jgi:hypothetical protein
VVEVWKLGDLEKIPANFFSVYVLPCPDVSTENSLLGFKDSS